MATKHDNVLRALRALFIPLASLLLKDKLTVAMVINELKSAFVEVARREYGGKARPASINRVAELTGMSRKHVSALIAKSAEMDRPESPRLLDSSAVLGVWANSEKYLDSRGTPRELEFGPGPGTFSELVRSVTGEQDVESCLHRFVQAGCVSIQGDKRISLVRRHYIGKDDNLAHIISLFLVPLATSISQNWNAPLENRHVVRAAHSARIQPDKVGVLRRVSRERLGAFLEDIDDVICSYELSGEEPLVSENGKSLPRIGVAAFYFEIEEQET